MAIALVTFTIPPLTAQYAAARSPPFKPQPEPVFTMLPPPLASITGITYLEKRNKPLRPTSRTKSHSFSDKSAIFFLTVTPALLCKISIFPNFATMASTVALTCSSLVTSHWKKAASRPASLNSCAFSSPLGLISTIAIFAP